MVEDMTVRNLSPATQRSYVRAVAKSGRFFGHPQQAHVMGAVPKMVGKIKSMCIAA
jgi:hypothetical protein